MAGAAFVTLMPHAAKMFQAEGTFIVVPVYGRAVEGRLT
jgi:hypothetical protein